MTDQEITAYIIEQMKLAGFEEESRHLTKGSRLEWFVGDVRCVIADAFEDVVHAAVVPFIERLLDDRKDRERQLAHQASMKKQIDLFIPVVADVALEINAALRKRKLDVGSDGLLVLTGAVILSASRF